MATKKQLPKETVIKGFKGFDKNFKCRAGEPGEKQYEVNKEFVEDSTEICSKGLHFCENPIDIFGYYSPADARFAEVEGSGSIDKKTGENEDSKVACTHLKIGAELSLHKIIDAGISFIFERTIKTKEKTNDDKGKQATNTLNKGCSIKFRRQGCSIYYRLLFFGRNSSRKISSRWGWVFQ